MPAAAKIALRSNFKPAKTSRHHEVSNLRQPEERPLAQAATVNTAGGHDILFKIGPITEFLRELLNEPDFPESKTYYWLARGFISGRKIGTLWSASKSELRRSLKEPTNLEGAGND